MLWNVSPPAAIVVLLTFSAVPLIVSIELGVAPPILRLPELLASRPVPLLLLIVTSENVKVPVLLVEQFRTPREMASVSYRPSSSR